VSQAEALKTLSEYLELALNRGGQLFVVKGNSGTSTLYLGETNESGVDGALKQCGVVANTLADAMLEATESGFNQLTFNDSAYRFIRSFTDVDGRGAVVFTAV
jgi:hypothetical protein